MNTDETIITPLRAAIERLRRSPAPDDDAHARASAAAEEVVGVLAEIAESTQELAGDVVGLSRALADEAARRAVLRSLRSSADQLRVVGRALDDAITPYVHAQVAALPRAAEGELKLDLTGAIHGGGWVHLGAEMADVYANLLWSLPFGDDEVSHVYFALAIEHLARDHVPALLGEVRRVLRPGGVLRIVTMDMEAHARAYVERDQAFFDGQAEQWPWTRELRTPLENVLAWAGTGRAPSHFFDHKWGYDFETLAAVLREAGFARVERSAFMASEHPALRIDDTSRDAGFGADDGRYSLFVDAS